MEAVDDSGWRGRRAAVVDDDVVAVVDSCVAVVDGNVGKTRGKTRKHGGNVALGVVVVSTHVVGSQNRCCCCSWASTTSPPRFSEGWRWFSVLKTGVTNLWLCPKVVVDSKVHQNDCNAVYTLTHSYNQPAGSEAGASSQAGTLGVLDVIRALALLINATSLL